MPTTAAPRPDSRTGEPRPPSAPLLPDWHPPQEDDLTKRKPWMTIQNDGRPILESFTVSKTTKVVSAVLSVVVLVIAGFIFWGGPGWMAVWWLWIIVFSGVPFFLLRGRVGSAAAGADWLVCAHGVVNTYELTRVKITRGSNTYFLGLTDEDGNEVDPQLWHVQRNPKLWDLVYNGILYSVAHGAECNDKTRKFLHIYT